MTFKSPLKAFRLLTMIGKGIHKPHEYMLRQNIEVQSLVARHFNASLDSQN